MYFSWIIKGKLAGSSMPLSVEDIEFVKNENISAIVCLVEEDEIEIQDNEHNTGMKAYINILKEKQIELLHSPIKDFNAPTIDQTEFILNWIKQKLNENKKVMIHCKGGQGRTGTIIAAFLIREYGYTADEAITTVRILRPGSIENYNQIRFLKYYEKYLRRRTKSK